MEVYAGMVNNMDYHFGRVVNYLKDIGEYENTVVIFMSDNGPDPWEMEDYPTNRTPTGEQWLAGFDNSLDNLGHPASHYAYGMGWASATSGPLDRFKMAVSEGGIRSPMLIGGPGVQAGSQVDDLAYVWDIMATMLDYAGATYPETFEGNDIQPTPGRSLRGVLTGSGDGPYSPEEFLAAEILNGMWVRQGDYKAVSVAPPYGAGTWHLYNIADDPGETRDLAGEQPETLTRLQAAWEQYADDVNLIRPN